jgi:hypothetical protein
MAGGRTCAAAAPARRAGKAARRAERRDCRNARAATGRCGMTPAEIDHLKEILRAELTAASRQISSEIRRMLTEIDELRALIEAVTGRPLPPRDASAPPRALTAQQRARPASGIRPRDVLGGGSLLRRILERASDDCGHEGDRAEQRGIADDLSISHPKSPLARCTPGYERTVCDLVASLRGSRGGIVGPDRCWSGMKQKLQGPQPTPPPGTPPMPPPDPSLPPPMTEPPPPIPIPNREQPGGPQPIDDPTRHQR